MNSKEKLLQIAFDEIYENGYASTSVDKILKKANMNKGSMYHFFKSKKELTLGMIEAHISKYIEDRYGAILEKEDNYIAAILDSIRTNREKSSIYGCRLNNLVQELSHKDEDFKKELEKIYLRFEQIIEEALKRALENKEISHPDLKTLSIFVVASLEGCLATAKKSQDEKVFATCINELENYFNQLKI